MNWGNWLSETVNAGRDAGRDLAADLLGLSDSGTPPAGTPPAGSRPPGGGYAPGYGPGGIPVKYYVAGGAIVGAVVILYVIYRATR